MNPKKSAKESTSGCISHDQDSNFNEVTNKNKSCYVSSSSPSSFHAITSTIPSKSSKSHSNIFVSFYKKIKASLAKPISLLRRKCSCFDKNSLHVKESNTLTPKASTSTTSSPTPQVQTLSQNKTTSKGKLKIDDDHKVEHEEEEPTHDSLHVFQPTSPYKSRVKDEEVASDASSDLFEIESTQEYPIRPTMIDCHETTTSNVLCDT